MLFLIFAQNCRFEKKSSPCNPSYFIEYIKEKEYGLTQHVLEIDPLIKACQAGQSKAQYELYQNYAKAMYHICLRITGQVTDAEDALQEAFVKAFQNIGRFDGRASFGTWLKKIVVNTALVKLRSYKQMELELQPESGNIEIEPEDDELILDMPTIKAAINELPDGYRVVFSLYLLEGYDHFEIAEILGISAATSKSQYSRAKRKLKELLKKQIRHA